MGFEKKRNRNPKNRQTKSILVFDEKARTEFLTGFRKRKDERRKKAHIKNEEMIKEEKRMLKQKRKEFMEKKIKHQHLPPDLEKIAQQHVTELPEHTVTITDISEVDLAGQGGVRLGYNKFEDMSEDTEVEITDMGNGDGEDNGTEEQKQDPKSLKKKKKILKQIDQKIQKKEKQLKLKKTAHKKNNKRTLSKKKKHKQKKSAY